MSNNKQSSVEWLVEKIQQANPSFKFDALIRQAKEMEKEQIEEAFANGVDDEYEYHINNHPRTNSEQYYTETFNSNEA